MKITFLGTGTSHGVPMIGCECAVCKSADPRNQRMRCSCMIEINKNVIVIDTPPEFRLQIVREKVKHLDAVLFTHAHADHVFGLDDVRRFNDLSGKFIPCYANAETLKIIRKAFDYVFIPTQIGGGIPMLELVDVTGPFEVAGVDVTPIPIRHGKLDIYGFRIGDFAYVTDCSHIPESSMELLQGLHTLVLGVIRHEPLHNTHFTVSQGLAVVDALKPKNAIFTHITHKLDHEETNDFLPDGVQLAYDGMQWVIE